MRTLIGAHLDRLFGEALPLETPWDLTFNAHSVEGNCHLLKGKAIYFELNSSYTFGDLDRGEADLSDLIISSKIENIYEAFNTQSDNPAVSLRVLETDSDEYWDKIIVYLMSLNVPDADKDEIRCIQRRAKAFFILDNILWRRNGNKPPLQVVLDHE